MSRITLKQVLAKQKEIETKQKELEELEEAQKNRFQAIKSLIARYVEQRSDLNGSRNSN